MECNLEQYFKVQYIFNLCSRNDISTYFPRTVKICVKQMLMVDLFIVTPDWKASNCPSKNNGQISWWLKSYQWLHIDRGREGLTRKKHKTTFWDDKSIIWVDIFKAYHQCIKTHPLLLSIYLHFIIFNFNSLEKIEIKDILYFESTVYGNFITQ